MAKTFRRTRQRESVRAVIEAATRPLRADEVLFLAREQVPELGLATVYRTLKLLVDEGELAEVKLRSGATRYEPVQREHDSFFLCDACSRAFPIEKRVRAQPCQIFRVHGRQPKRELRVVFGGESPQIGLRLEPKPQIAIIFRNRTGQAFQ